MGCDWSGHSQRNGKISMFQSHARDKTDEVYKEERWWVFSESRGLTSLILKDPTDNPETAPQLLLEDDRRAGSNSSDT